MSLIYREWGICETCVEGGGYENDLSEKCIFPQFNSIQFNLFLQIATRLRKPKERSNKQTDM